MQPVHPVPGDPHSHERPRPVNRPVRDDARHPDPVERDFPDVPPALAEHLTRQPNTPPCREPHVAGGPPKGIDLLKLWVRQFETGEVTKEDVSLRLSGPTAIRTLAGIIGAWEKEREESAARFRDLLEKSTSRGQADREVVMRLRGRDERLDREHGKYVDLMQAATTKLLDERNALQKQVAAQAVTIQAFQEATGIDDMAEHHGGIEMIRPARDATVLTVLSDSSITKIADAVAARVMERV